MIFFIQGNRKEYFLSGAYQGGGAGGIFFISLLLEIRPSNININTSILIREIQKNIFFARGVPMGVGARIVFSLLLEIGRSNLYISIFSKKFKKYFFCQGRARGRRGNIFLIIRDRTFKYE